MGKQSGRKKGPVGGKSGDSVGKQHRTGENSPKAYDKDTAVFIAMSQELKDEGNRLFQKRDYEGAMLKYEKALKLLPRVHIDVSYLRSNMAACYMQMGLSEYPRAINECNLALEVTPKYSKALLKRARCYEALNRLDLALRDTSTVLNMEPNNVMALEIADRVKATIAEKGLTVNNESIELPPDYVEPPSSSSLAKRVKEKARKKKGSRIEGKKPIEKPKEIENVNKVEENKAEQIFESSKDEEGAEDKKPEDKAVVEEKIVSIQDEEPKKTVKLVYGEDIRWAQLPVNCSLLQVREVVHDRFSSSRAVLVKYRDQEGDLVTITTDEELRWAEASTEPQGSIRLYVVPVNPDQDPFHGRISDKYDVHDITIKNNGIQGNGHVVKADEAGKKPTCIDDWIINFAQLFKNYVGLDSDEYLDLHELGMKLYSEAMEETITSDEAQGIFTVAAEKFQEMAALALFNWGNVHMSRARKGVHLPEDASEDSLLEQIKIAYDRALKEYTSAGKRFEEALKIKPDFYEGYLALGQQQFERAKLSWYYALGSKADLETWPSTEILQLYNYAEDNMEKGMQMWEEWEEQRLRDLSNPNTSKVQLQQLGLDGSFNEMTANEAADQAANMRSQINLLWGSILYERSIVEFKLGLPVWHECLEVAVEKFELAGASPTDIAVMVKNHCSNHGAMEGLGFKIDEIIQAWNEMYEAKKLRSGVPSFRLEPLFRRRTSGLHHALEQH